MASFAALAVLFACFGDPSSLSHMGAMSSFWHGGRRSFGFLQHIQTYPVQAELAGYCAGNPFLHIPAGLYAEHGLTYPPLLPR